MAEISVPFPNPPLAPEEEAPETPVKPPETPVKPPEQQQTPTPPTPPEKAPGEQPTGEQPSDKTVEKFVVDAGLDPVALSRQILDTGNIGEKERKVLAEKLEKVGLPSALMDDYISGQKYVAEALRRDVQDSIGGPKEFEAMAAWASENVPPEELAAFNEMVQNTRNPNGIKFAVKGLYDRYRNANRGPGRPRVNTGNRRDAASAGDIYRSLEQQIEAQSDPRYEGDSAFRADVEAKIARTMRSGGYRFTNL
jgi:hypothetical protein